MAGSVVCCGVGGDSFVGARIRRAP
ncbi:Actin-7 [Zea mays]|uniref:Actin-7 n=1 Tax=Zea mays TaxID=4577 RepID=A0A1D6LI47_MAIZE|nr:Actin-7 [Zea mays]